MRLVTKVNAMDLAGTPTLPGTFHPGADQSAGHCACVIDAADAASPAFGRLWDDLAADPSEPNPFFERWFLLPSLREFGHDTSPQLLAVFAQDRLIGIMPIARPARYYGYPIPHVSAWLHDNAFCGAPLIARGSEGDFWRAVLGHFDRVAGAAMFLHLPQIPRDGPANAALGAVLSETGRRAVIVEENERAMLFSKANAEDYLAQSMSTKKRKELRRQHKRLGEKGALIFERTQDADGMDAWIADFLNLEAAGWKGDAGSALASAADTRAFFTDSLTGAAKYGRLERLTMRLDGKPIAMLANFVTPPGVFSFKTAFDETYSRYSPGLLIQIENLDLLARGEIEWADSCAVQGHSMIERIWREKRSIISRNVAIGGVLRQSVFRALMAYETRGKKAGEPRS